jgi:hypothetical protein
MPLSIHPSATSRCHTPSCTTTEVASQDSSWDEQGHQEQGISHVCNVRSAGRLEISVTLRAQMEFERGSMRHSSDRW